jgi:MoaA/NifB/PqqE/SkfB family radical SAM enzyme
VSDNRAKSGSQGAAAQAAREAGSSEAKVVFAQIEPTTRCNFTCGFCSGRQMDQSDLALDDFDRLLESFPDLEHLELQGEGEPLLHKGFFQMARRARARGIRLSMITNGSLLSEERVAAILEVGMVAVNVSIESPEDAAFQRIRGGRLDKVKAGIARLLAARNARGMRVPKVGFSVTVLRETIESLPQIAALYRELGMDGGATFQALSRMDAYTDVYDSEMVDQLLSPEARRRFVELRQAPDIKAMMVAASSGDHFYPEMSRRFRPEHGCPWVRGGLYVDRHGAMTTCCMVKDSATYGLGKLGITPVEAVLAQRRDLDAELEAGRPPAQCLGCGYYRSPAMREARRRRKLAQSARQDFSQVVGSVKPE